MIRFYAILYFLLSGLFSAEAQTTIQYYPGGTACRNAISLDSGDTIWTGSSTRGLLRCSNDTCIEFNVSNSGIASNWVTSIGIDSTNRIWVGTKVGISIYDHVSWSTLTTQNSGLPNDTVNCITHTALGAWIGTNNGLSFYDGTTWTLYNSQNSGIHSNRITDVVVDGAIFYTSHDSAVSRYDGTWSAWNISPAQFEPYPRLQVASGRLWVNGDLYLDQNSFKSIWENMNNFSPRYKYYQGYKPSNRGLAAEESGDLYTLPLLSNFQSVMKISPDLEINASDIHPNGFGAISGDCFFRNKKFYVVGLANGLKIISLDTSTYYSKEKIKGTSNDYLDINNSTVRLLNRGDMHWDPVSQTPGYFSDTNSFKHPVYCSAIWLGGMDQSGLLHSVAQNYRQSYTFNFLPGPMDTISGIGDTNTLKQYDRFWKIDYSMIQSFITNYQNGNVQNGTYLIPEAIATWPAHGTGNHTRQLAPFVDANGDGFYNPMDGDYPELTGHQMLWWVFNDSTVPYPHYDPEGPAFQFEIQGKAYGYNCNLNQAADEVMNNTTFYQYKITNRSQNTYHDVYIGLWTDFDLGNASDDYVACDTMLNTYYCYNGDADDDGTFGYGLNPPMMNVTVLKGPTVQTADGLDNNHNGIIDESNETTGLSSFLYYRTLNNVPDGEPFQSQQYYYYLTSRWLDGMHWTYGSSGRDPGNPLTNYIFSGIPFNTAANNWTMATAGMQPDDMRGTGATGPFTIGPGESRTIDFAYIFTRDSLNPNGLTTSIAKNTADVQKIINGFNSGNYPCLTTVGLPSLAHPVLDFNLYPNPATNTLYFNKEMIGAEYKIYSVTGQLVKSGIYTGNSISTENLSPQLYIIKANKDGKDYMKRFVKM